MRLPTLRNTSLTADEYLDNDFDLRSSFFHSFLVIILSELGDKTFFIAAILAMRFSRRSVLMGSMAALFLMTVISVIFGNFASKIIPNELVTIVGTILFFVLGVKMLIEARFMSSNKAQMEIDEASEDVNQKSLSTMSKKYKEQDGILAKMMCQLIRLYDLISLGFAESAFMVFMAEWGDRSQVMTVLMATKENPYGVTLGAIIGHTICSAIAVMGGRFIASKISVKTITYIASTTFILFGLESVYTYRSGAF